MLLARQLASIVVVSFLLIYFQNCSSSWQVQPNQILEESSASPLDYSEVCENELREYFSKTWHPLLVQYCNECHAYGHGSYDVKISYDGFKSRGESRIYNNLTTSHKGRNFSSNRPIVDQFLPFWNEAKKNYQTCLSGQ